ncbi:hypothetical protein ABGN35_004542 [Yersinia enterocolitica]
MLTIFLFPIITWAIIVIILRNDKSSVIIPVRAERGNNITQTSITHKELSHIHYRALTSRPFYRFIATLIYEWVRSLLNVIYLLPRVLFYLAFIYCIYNPSIITEVNLDNVQIVFAALSKNIESFISLIMAISVLELFYREGLYSISSSSINEIGIYKTNLIRQHFNFPSDAKIVIQRSKRKKSEG